MYHALKFKYQPSHWNITAPNSR